LSDKVTASDVLKALKLRHTKDVFVSECNLGSANAGCRRMDAWAMPRSWSPFKTIGYEIKVSRSDFLNDDKWHEYMPFVHEFWFACPWKLISPDELPKGVGLLWMNNGGTMVRKKKAARFTPTDEKMSKAMAYVLMSRCQIVPSSYNNSGTALTEDDWQLWLSGKDEHSTIGRLVGAEMRKRVGDIKSENFALKRTNERMKDLAVKLREIGLDPEHLSSWNIQSKVEELRGIADQSTLRRIRNMADNLTTLASDLEELRGQQ